MGWLNSKAQGAEQGLGSQHMTSCEATLYPTTLPPAAKVFRNHRTKLCRGHKSLETRILILSAVFFHNSRTSAVFASKCLFAPLNF